MKINLNIDRLIDMMMEADDATFDYWKSSKVLYKKRGYGVDMDRAKTAEEKHIVYAYYSDEKANNAVWSILQVLGFDREQGKRLRIAYRAVKRWYEKETKWQRCLPDDLIERVEKFVIGVSA